MFRIWLIALPLVARAGLRLAPLLPRRRLPNGADRDVSCRRQTAARRSRTVRRRVARRLHADFDSRPAHQGSKSRSATWPRGYSTATAKAAGGHRRAGDRAGKARPARQPTSLCRCCAIRQAPVRRGAAFFLLGKFDPAQADQVAAFTGLLDDEDRTVRGFGLSAVKQMRSQRSGRCRAATCGHARPQCARPSPTTGSRSPD